MGLVTDCFEILLINYNMDISQEERERRSLRAKQLIKEGKLGGARFGAGRPVRQSSVDDILIKLAETGKDLVVAWVHKRQKGK
jgi:hypothetical protein